MKSNCEGCQRSLSVEAEAYVCSYECTFCADCASMQRRICPHCGGELLRRPRRISSAGVAESDEAEVRIRNRPGLIWAASFGVWAFLSLVATATIYQLYRPTPNSMSLRTVAGMQFAQLLSYAPLTPFVYALAIRYPLQRGNWIRRSLLHLVAGLVFTAAHISFRGLTPYGYWDPQFREWTSVIWNSHNHVFRAPWRILESMFFSSVFDDVTGAYVPIVLIAVAVSYYRRFRERELRASQLEAQLAKARLQALKSQLQPHFLFNTMHSISALMLTDVRAADRMMSRLSDLLRMSLDAEGTQITTLSRELEFVNSYLEIEKIRFEDRLNVILDIAPETLDAQVPHLLLQPLVDNAVKHGISKLSAGGEIRISVTTQDGDLQLEISDNGPGFGSASFRNGLGLRVTRERLESLYGQDQSMELLSPLEGGATVLVHIPFRAQSGESREDVPVATLRHTG
jgi:two-component system LytT family sensor kinase